MHNISDNHWSYFFPVIHIIYIFFLLNFIATVSVLFMLLGRKFTVVAITNGTFIMFLWTSFCLWHGKFQICIKGILGTTSLYSIGYRFNSGGCFTNPILLYIENLGTLESHIAIWHILHVHSVLSFNSMQTLHFG